MAAKFDKEKLIKHHFWILLIVLVPVVLIALLGLWGGAAGAITEKAEEIGKAKSSLESAKAEGAGLLSGYDEQKVKLHQKRGDLWKEAWNFQKDVFVRPSPKDMPNLAVQPFGTELPLDIDLEQFQRANSGYVKLYEKLAASVEPTRFLGQQRPGDRSWVSVLQPVQKWIAFPTSEDVWLALEDYWIRAEMVSLINSVNTTIGSFTLVGDASDKFHRKFQSRLWEVDIQLATVGEKRRLKGTLKNITERRLTVGMDRTMTLKVFLKQGNLPPQPFEIPIEGSSVGAGESLVFPPPITQEDRDAILAKYELNEDINPSEISGVEQVFDLLTVPVKQINAIELARTSNRTYKRLPLKMTEFSKKATAPPEGSELDPNSGEFGEGGGVPGGEGYEGSPDGGPGGLPGGEGGIGGAQQLGQYTDNYLRRDRYIEVTKQVRRMPVAASLIVDQAYVQDVLVAFSNSRLRFQTTQFEWKRMDLDVMTFAMSGAGVAGSGGEGGTPAGPGYSPASPPGFGRPGGGVGGIGSGRPGFPPMGGRPGFPPGAGSPEGGFPGGEGYPGGGQPAGGATPERSLVELGIYGTMSLYNQYDPKAASEPDEPVADEGY